MPEDFQDLVGGVRSAGRPPVVGEVGGAAPLKFASAQHAARRMKGARSSDERCMHTYLGPDRRTLGRQLLDHGRKQLLKGL
jgi:hypothetical protein